MPAFRGFVLGLDRALGAVESALLAALVLVSTAVTFTQVFSRYVLENPVIWSEEVARYLFVWIVLIGAAAAVRMNAHYGLDILRRHFPGTRTALGLATSLVVVIFLGVLFTTGLAETRQAVMQQSPSLPIRMHWPYLAIPVGAGLALWHMLAHWVRAGIAGHPLDNLNKPA